jgi:hypothetical protein
VRGRISSLTSISPLASSRPPPLRRARAAPSCGRCPDGLAAQGDDCAAGDLRPPLNRCARRNRPGVRSAGGHASAGGCVGRFDVTCVDHPPRFPSPDAGTPPPDFPNRLLRSTLRKSAGVSVNRGERYNFRVTPLCEATSLTAATTRSTDQRPAATRAVGSDRAGADELVYAQTSRGNALDRLCAPQAQAWRPALWVAYTKGRPKGPPLRLADRP